MTNSRPTVRQGHTFGKTKRAVNTESYYCEYCGPLLYQNMNMFLETSKLLLMLNDKVITLTKSIN